MVLKSSRLEEIRQALGLKKAQMATLMGVDPTYYSGILQGKGKANLRLEHLESLLDKASVNPIWVITGEGEMFVTGPVLEIMPGEPTQEQIDQLYEYVLNEYPADLNPRQKLKFKLACAQCYVDNPGIKTLRDLSIAAKVYLKLIVDNPKVDIIDQLGLDEPKQPGHD